MGYPIEESPFAQLVRRQLQRIRGEAYGANGVSSTPTAAGAIVVMRHGVADMP